jgi:Arc/MetJ family transcription regulator
MGVNVTVDEKLVEEAKRLTGLASESAAVEQLLQRLFAGRNKHKALLDLVGKVEFHEGYDPRSIRSSRYDAD